jgi:uncharacterized protein (DUF433 family)
VVKRQLTDVENVFFKQKNLSLFGLRNSIVMTFSQIVSKVPINTDEHGVVRVGGTRVTLESVIAAFQMGATSEEIVMQFPVLELGDVYAVIGYYLKNRDDIDTYLQEHEVIAAKSKRIIQENFPPTDLRTRLLERKHNAPKG